MFKFISLLEGLSGYSQTFFPSLMDKFLVSVTPKKPKHEHFS